MMVKLMNRGVAVIYEGRHVAITALPCRGRDEEEGFELEITSLEPGRPSEIINIPEDGQTAYVMNHHGQTTDTYRWPPKAR